MKKCWLQFCGLVESHFGFGAQGGLGLEILVHELVNTVVMASSSTQWSCGTLRDGINLMDLELEEQALQKQLEASISGILCKI